MELTYSLNTSASDYPNMTCSNEYCVSDEDYLAMIEEYITPSPLEWALIGLHALVFVVGLVGNALVCVSVYRNHSMRTVTNCFIVNLAAADFLVILVCLPPTVLWDVTETWFFGSVMCKIVLYLQSVSVSVSVLTLTFISIDRWYAICRPLSFKSTAASSKTAILLIWLISCLLVIPELLYLDTRQQHVYLRDTVYLTDCAYTWTDGHTRAYQMFLLVALYLAPFVLMAAAYYHIAKVLWNTDIPGARETHHYPRTAAVTSSSNHRNGAAVRLIRPNCETQIQSRRKAAKMLISVVIIFGICYLPVHLINALRYTVGLPQTKVTTFFSLASHWLCYANSSINPIIYNFMNAKFRREFQNFLCCWCCRKSYLNRHDDNNTTGTRYRFTTSVTQMENINLTTIDRT